MRRPSVNARIGIALAVGAAAGVGLWLGTGSSPEEREAQRREAIASELGAQGGVGGLNRDAIELLLELPPPQFCDSLKAGASAADRDCRREKQTPQEARR